MKQRLDRLLVERKLSPSREKAQALVMAGKVRVDGQPAGKSGRMVSTVSHLEVLCNDQQYVSRGGVKLKAALKYFNIDPSGLVTLDIGYSTGGFSHCLILGGAEKQALCENTFCKYGRFFIKKRRDQRFCSKMCREQAFYYSSKSRGL